MTALVPQLSMVWTLILTPNSPSLCIYVRHSQLWTPRSWPRNCISSYSYGQPHLLIMCWIFDSGCIQFFIATTAVSLVTDWGMSMMLFSAHVPSKSHCSTRDAAQMASVTREQGKSGLVLGKCMRILQYPRSIVQLSGSLLRNRARDNGDKNSVCSIASLHWLSHKGQYVAQ